MKAQLVKRASAAVAALALVLLMALLAAARADGSASCVGQFKSVLQSGTGGFVQSLHEAGLNIGRDVARVLARNKTGCP